MDKNFVVRNYLIYLTIYTILDKTTIRRLNIASRRTI